MLQTSEEIENDKIEKKEKEKIENILQLQCSTIQRKQKDLNDKNNEEKINLLIEKMDANDGMIVSNKISFENWFVDDEFENNKNIKILDNSKTYFDNFIKKAEDNKIEIDNPDLTIEAFNEDNNSKRTMTFEKINTLDEILLEPTEKYNNILKRKKTKQTKLLKQPTKNKKLNANDDNNDKNNNDDPQMSNNKRQRKQRRQSYLH